MNENEKLAAKIAKLTHEIKEREEERDGLRATLLSRLDEEVEYLDQGVETLSGEQFPTYQHVLDWFALRYGSTYVIEEYVFNGTDWTFRYKQLPQHATVKKTFGQYQVNRVAYTTAPQIDLELLEKLSPEVYAQVTREHTVRELDEEALEEYVRNNPDAFSALNKAVKSGKPRTRLDINMKKSS